MLTKERAFVILGFAFVDNTIRKASVYKNLVKVPLYKEA